MGRQWLEESSDHPMILSAVLQPIPSEQMEAHEVSSLVNSPDNDSPECIHPVARSQAQRRQSPDENADGRQLRLSRGLAESTCQLASYWICGTIAARSALRAHLIHFANLDKTNKPTAMAMPNSDRRLKRLHLALIVLSLSTSFDNAFAQITLDGSMGVRRADWSEFHDSASVGQTRGSNLFHSFGLFNVLTGQSATFTGPNSISNIFGRVTGGQPSNIDGTIRSTIPNANLYLMNPAGMMFGPNASWTCGDRFTPRRRIT